MLFTYSRNLFSIQKVDPKKFIIQKLHMENVGWEWENDISTKFIYRFRLKRSHPFILHGYTMLFLWPTKKMKNKSAESANFTTENIFSIKFNFWF